MEIVHGVYRVDNVSGSNVYLLVGHELSLIDTGMPGNATQILRFIRKLGRDPKELASIIVTHRHIDHTGSLAELRARTGAKAIAHTDEVTSAGEGRYTLLPRLEAPRGIIFWLLEHLGKFKPSLVDSLVKDGDVLPYLGGSRVIHTPGHTRGSICLLLAKSKVLFAGDTIINNEDRLSRPLPFGADKFQSEQSLMKLAELDFNICCFGHGPPLFSAREKIRELAESYPTSPLYWRITKNVHRLACFIARLWQR